MEYPYYKNIKSKNDILRDFDELKNYKPKFLSQRECSKMKLTKFRGRYTVIVDNYDSSKDMYNITDYFSEVCRVQCVYNEGKNSDSVLNKFKKDFKSITMSMKENNVKITTENLREEIFKRYKQCTTFKTTIVKSLLEIFKPKRWLDPSMGWGDRLIGSLAYNCEYVGVDPSECMKDIYPEIKKFFKGKDQKFLNEQFELVKLNEEKFDLVFTSPPFFDLELYDIENKDKTQSTKYSSLKKWKEEFLYILADKSFKNLKKGGNLALYISDYRVNGKKFKYVADLKNYIKNKHKDVKYEGVIHFLIKPGRSLRMIYVWKKL